MYGLEHIYALGVHQNFYMPEINNTTLYGFPYYLWFVSLYFQMKMIVVVIVVKDYILALGVWYGDSSYYTLTIFQTIKYILFKFV